MRYKFLFKFSTQSLVASGDGEVRAEDITAAIVVAENGVAQDFKGSTADVTITSISEVRHANNF